MKSKHIAAAIFFVLASAFTLESSAKGTITMVDAMGRVLTMPVKGEEAAVEFPFDTTFEFHCARIQQVNNTLELSNMIKPEKDADDITIDLKAVFDQTVNNR